MPAVVVWSRLTTKEYKGTFGGDRNVLYCDGVWFILVVGYGLLAKLNENFILKFGIFNYICIILNKVGLKRNKT